MNRVFDGVKAAILDQPLLSGWAIGLGLLLGNLPTLWPALVLWVLLGAYVAAALAFQRAFEEDRIQGEMDAALAALRGSFQATLGEIGRSVRPVLEAMAETARQAMAAFAAALSQPSVREAVARAIHVEERRNQAIAAGMPEEWFDLIVEHAVKESTESPTSFMVAFERWWDVVYRAWVSALGMEEAVAQVKAILESSDSRVAALGEQVRRMGLNDQGKPYLGILHVPGVVPHAPRSTGGQVLPPSTRTTPKGLR